ncbi:MAG: ABC transporter substrate-binding protein [bacterium]|nr:ABC transporter substrate-binding protein [bacterium]
MKFSFRVFLALVVAFVMLAAGCGNDDDDTSTIPVEATAQSTETPQAPEPEPEPTEASSDESTDTAGDEPEDMADSETEEMPEEPEEDYSTFVSIEGVDGVSDTEIAVAVIGTKSNNPTGICALDCYATGVQAYFDKINDEGGIWGRELVISDVVDDELFNNQAAALEVIADGDAFAVFTATLFASGWVELDNAGVPSFHWGIHAPEADGKLSNFSIVAPTCAGCTVRHIPYLVQQGGGTRVAALGIGVTENSRICTGSYRDSINMYSEEIGAEMAYFNDELEFGLPNGIGPQVTAMIEADVDFVVSCMDLNSMITLAQELQRQGVRDSITLHHANAYDHAFVEESGELFEGDYVAIQLAPQESDMQIVRDFLHWTEENGGPTSEQTMSGWVNAHLFVEGLKVAGPEFDRESYIDAANTQLTSYTADGMINATDWSRQHSSPTPDDRTSNGHELECQAIVQVKDKAFEIVSGDPTKPFLCWDNSNTDWAQPEPTSFE